MEFFKSVGGKIISGLVALGVIFGAIAFWRMDASARSALIGGTGKLIAWLGIVALLPWATFFLIGRVGRMGSNLAGGLLVTGYTLLELLLLGWMFDWSMHGGLQWTFVGFGALLAAVYNLFTCDWIAEKVA